MGAFRSEAAFRQELALGAVLVPLGCWLGHTGVERALLVAPMVLIWIVELINSAIEATVDLQTVLPVGTNLRTLTVSYHEADLEEHRLAFRGLTVQSPKFFRWLSQLYTSGAAAGFDGEALRRSPKTLRWLDRGRREPSAALRSVRAAD